MTRRIERINHLIRTEISELLRRQIKDPRLLEMLAVTDVETSSDLKYARIYVSCLCSEEDKQATLKALASASGFLRTELARRLQIRRVPELTFHWDESIERGTRVLDLIDRVAKDKNL